MLLAETPSEPPCGPNLEYDPAFVELERLASGRAEQQFGDTVIAGEEPNWPAVRQQAAALLSRTKDLRICMHLLRALTRTGDILGLYAGLQVILQFLERYWDSLHPGLDPDEDNDPTMRLNALAPLADPETVLRDVRQAAVLAVGSMGKITVRDVLAMQGKVAVAGDEKVPSPAELEEMVRAAGDAGKPSLEALHDSIQAVDRIYSFLSEKVGADRAPDLTQLSSLLKPVSQACAAFGGPAPEAPPAEVPAVTAASESPSSAPVVAAAAIGELRSRADALRLLDKVCEFIEKNEPGHPAPLLIRRAQRLMTKSFVEIIEDLAPDSLSEIRKIAGVNGE